MSCFLQCIRYSLVAMMLACVATSVLHAQRPVDTIQVIQTQGGTYNCCYDLLVTNKQTDTNLKISEVRMRIISGRASFVPGVSEAPPNWVATQNANTIFWTSNAASRDIASGQTESGFRVCVRDTGVFRMVWETRNLDSVISTDTFAFACRGIDCDEAFFRNLPSQSICAVDIDLAAGNGTGRLINDFHLHPITPGVTFVTTPSTTPPGWIRLRSKADTIVFFTGNNALDRDQFAEGFRVELNAPADSNVLIEWWSTAFGDIICRDTVTIRCGLTRPDSIRITRADAIDSCCQNIRLRNTHLPSSPITGFSIETISTGATILAAPILPAGWSRSAFTPSRDSIAFVNPNGLAANDTALFRSICFDNTEGRTDSVRYMWRTYSNGVPVNEGIGASLCIRPLTAYDSVTARVDSTVPATQRCVSLFLRNRNSRQTPIQRFVVRISNTGTARRIVSAQAPSPWSVQSFGGDSVVFVGGVIVPGGALGPFTFCMSQGDATTRDPVTIRWTTSNSIGPISSDSLNVNAIITNDCDSAQGVEKQVNEPNTCCFDLSFLNRNGRNRTLDAFRLEVRSSEQVIFNNATASGGWSLATQSLPSFDLEFNGATLAPGESAPPFTVCFDVSQRPLPATIPVVWRSFAGGTQICSDTVRLLCTGQSVEEECDTVPLISVRPAPGNGCRLAYRIVNRHTPAGPVDGVRFRLIQGSTRIQQGRATGAASTWTDTADGQSVIFRGPALASGSSLDSFIVRLDTTREPVVIEACTMNGDQILCCSQHTVVCGGAGVELTFEPTGFLLHENMPNPFNGVTEIRYDLLRAASVTIVVRDASGAELRRIDRGREEQGSHALRLDISDLPSGIYYYSLEAGGEMTTRRMVMVK